MNNISKKVSRGTMRRKLFLQKTKPEMDSDLSMPNKIRSVNYGSRENNFSFVKSLKRACTINKKVPQAPCRPIEEKLKYFYRPYNNKIQQVPYMEFDEEVSIKNTNRCGIKSVSPVRRSCWKKVSKIIFTQDDSILKQIKDSKQAQNIPCARK